MTFYILCLSAFAHFSISLSIKPISENLRKKLNAEEKREFCCHNSLPCCKTLEIVTNFEIKSIITQCPNEQCLNYTSHMVVKHQKEEKLVNCNQKLLLTIKLLNDGTMDGKSQYVIIDHITDPNTLKKVRILNPYAVRIRQAPILEVYDLGFEKSVNSEAKERIFNKFSKGYEGCDKSKCGVRQGGGLVPFSEGFCCSCQGGEKEDGPGSVPGYNKKQLGEDDNNHYDHYGFTGWDGKMVYGRAQKRADKSVNYRQLTQLKDEKPERHRRGPSCDNLADTSLDPFEDSTHCLTFSNLWYGVYHLNRPRLFHKLRIQIFQKYEDFHGTTHWMDLTQAKVVEIGTKTTHYINQDFIAKYSSPETELEETSLDYKSIKLLIPEKRLTDPEQFLILPKKIVAHDGTKCDTAGVGYEAFYKQTKRCVQRPGTCLKNQPQHLHNADLEAQRNGQRGQYFLKFFGSLAQDPLVYNSTGQIQFLKMVYTKKHISTIYFELNADVVTLLKPNAYATITEIYTDATNPQKTKMVVRVANAGLLHGIFYVRLNQCPVEVPSTLNNIASKAVLIPPQMQHVFNLHIEYLLPVKALFCAIHVYSINQELVAMRKIRVQAGDRCVCIWHCECTCYRYHKRLTCTPLALEDYHLAGFQGGFTHPIRLVAPSSLDEILGMFFSTFMFLLVALLCLGLVKAVVGSCIPAVGLAGLNTILGAEQMIHCENNDCVNRNHGLSMPARFCLNVVFFLLYPTALCNIAMKKIFYPSYTMEKIEGETCNDDVCPTTSTKSGRKSDFSLQYSTTEERSTLAGSVVELDSSGENRPGEEAMHYE